MCTYIPSNVILSNSNVNTLAVWTILNYCLLKRNMQFRWNSFTSYIFHDLKDIN